jgi:hypothetical protein
VSVRRHGEGDVGLMAVGEFADQVVSGNGPNRRPI